MLRSQNIEITPNIYHMAEPTYVPDDFYVKKYLKNDFGFLKIEEIECQENSFSTLNALSAPTSTQFVKNIFILFHDIFSFEAGQLLNYYQSFSSDDVCRYNTQTGRIIGFQDHRVVVAYWMEGSRDGMIIESLAFLLS